MTGWAPKPGESRRKDFTRAAARARELRPAPTPSEARLWKLLRLLNRDEGAHWRRQAHVGPYVFDFAELASRRLIELDGGVHALPDQERRDAEKAADAAARGFALLRLANRDVWDHPDWTLDQIRAFQPPP